MVDVCMITYNHESFIAQAIEGFLIQKTSFQTRLIIGEDGSKDSTRAICIEYQSKYPEKIILLPDEGNLGMNINFMRTLKACTAKYVALCEGDDYWTDSSKLQIQVDFMENNINYVGCFGNATYLSDDLTISNKLILSGESKNINQSDIVYNNSILTLTTMFRNRNIDLINGFNKLKIADWVIWSYLASFGDFYYINENWAKYRLHGGGVFSSIGQKNKTINLSVTQIYINKITNGKYHDIIKDKLISDFNIFIELLPKKFIDSLLFSLKLRNLCGFKPFNSLIINYIPKNKLYFLCIAIRNKLKF